MLRRSVGPALVAGAAALTVTAIADHRDLTGDPNGATFYANNFDPNYGISGAISDTASTTVVFGPGAARPVKRYGAFIIYADAAADDPGMNTAVVRVVDGEILGAVSTFSSQGNSNLLAYFTAADGGPENTNINVQVDEFPNFYSDTIGRMMPDGRLFYRANLGGSGAQNNLETVKGDVLSQLPSLPEPTLGSEILTGTCTSGGTNTNCFLGVPDALSAGGSAYWVGNTNFNANDPNSPIPNGLNIWKYDTTGGPVAVGSPTYSYDQTAAAIYANNNGVPVTPLEDARQTQPLMENVSGTNYVVFGIGDDTDGGSARPRILVVDEFEVGPTYPAPDPNANFSDAIPVLPPQGWRFVDHQATGGGGGPFENKHFDINSKGELVVLAEYVDPVDPNTNMRSYAVLRYSANLGGGKILGFNSPTTIADATVTLPNQVDEGLVAGFTFDAISGVAINEAGNIAFYGNYDTGIPDPNNPLVTIKNSAVYFYEKSSGTIHRVISEGATVGSTPSVTIEGFFPSTGSDSFFAGSLADEDDVLVASYRDDGNVATLDTRGVLVLDLRKAGCEWDLNGDGKVCQEDLGLLLAGYGTIYTQANLGALLAQYNGGCGNPCQ